MRLVFLGSPEDVVTPLQWIHEHAASHGHQLVGVVSQPARPAGRGRQLLEPAVAERARALEIPVLQPERASSAAFLEAFAAWRPDVAITAAYGQILTEQFLQIPTRATINVHPSLLPKYRGAIPVPASLLAGDETTGVTILFTVKALDAGSIIVQHQFDIEPDETADQLTRRLFAASGPLVFEALAQLQDGGFVGTPQDPARVSHCRKINKTDGLVDWSLAATTISQRFRAYYPWPGTFTFFQAQRLALVDLKLHEGSSTSLPSGQVRFDAATRRLIVGCGTGAIAVSQVKRDGGKAIDAQSFWNGIKDRQNIRFDSQAAPAE